MTLPIGFFCLVGPFDNLNDRFVTGLSAAQQVLWYENVVGQGAAFGDEETVVVTDFEFPDECLAGAFQYFNHFGLARVT